MAKLELTVVCAISLQSGFSAICTCSSNKNAGPATISVTEPALNRHLPIKTNRAYLLILPSDLHVFETCFSCVT